MTPSQHDRVIAGRYAVGELIGRGGMADVHAGIDRRLDRPVAIKRLRLEMAADAGIRSRFETEARLAARLCHPNAVAVYDTGEHRGVPYIVMERLPGETLADRLAGGAPADPEWVRTVALDVLAALAAAHDRGIVHRDVKPANVLIASDGGVKLADFGIAKSLSPAPGLDADPTAAGTWIGTPAYLAPERLGGAAASARSDIYSLGVLLYEALAGFKPFTGDSPVAEAQAIVKGEPPPLGGIRPDLDPALVAVVARAMNAEPRRRFPSAGEMADALVGGQEELATLSGEVAPALGRDQRTQVLQREVPRPRWRSPRLLAAAAAVLAAIVAIALAGSADSRQPRTTDAKPPAASVVPPPAPPVIEPSPTPGDGATTQEVVTPPQAEPSGKGKSKGKGTGPSGSSGED